MSIMPMYECCQRRQFAVELALWPPFFLLTVQIARLSDQEVLELCREPQVLRLVAQILGTQDWWSSSFDTERG